MFLCRDHRPALFSGFGARDIKRQFHDRDWTR
jgi:hypothetical protein